MMILFTVMGALARLLGLCSLGKVSIGNAVIVLLQILFSGIVVIYLDDILKRDMDCYRASHCSLPQLFGKGLKLEESR